MKKQMQAAVRWMQQGVETAPWTNVYGVARTLLACGTLLSLSLHDADALFRPFGSTMSSAVVNPAVPHTLFSLFPEQHLELARWLAVGVLLLVVSGWRPRITGILHWYVSVSFALSTFVIEGGDQVTAILTLLLVPITLTDPRRSHWQAWPAGTLSGPREHLALVALSSWAMIRLQVAFIYFQASVDKMKAPDWSNGTALYYWFQDPVFGAPDWLGSALLALFRNPAAVTLSTWGVMLFELLLFGALFMSRRHRKMLLVSGLLFHFGIIIVHGLGSFFFAMAGGLVLYLRPPGDTFELRWGASPVAIGARLRTLCGVASLAPSLETAPPTPERGVLS